MNDANNMTLAEFEAAHEIWRDSSRGTYGYARTEDGSANLLGQHYSSIAGAELWRRKEWERRQFQRAEIAKGGDPRPACDKYDRQHGW